MPPSVAEGMISGIYRYFAARRDSRGYPKGILRTPETPVVNTVYGAFSAKSVISFTPGNATYERAQERGGQALGVARDLGPTDWGAPTLNVSRFPEKFDSMLSDYDVDVTTLTNAVITARNSQRSGPVPLIFGVCVGWDSEGNAGYYETIVYPNCSLRPTRPGSSQSGGVNPNPLAYTLTVSPSEASGLGLPFEDFALDLNEDEDTDFMIRHEFMYHVATYVSNGIALTFSLPYLPMSDDVTGAVDNLITKNGVVTPVTSISKTTGLVTLAAAGTTGDIWVIAYPTKYKTL